MKYMTIGLIVLNLLLGTLNLLLANFGMSMLNFAAVLFLLVAMAASNESA